MKFLKPTLICALSLTVLSGCSSWFGEKEAPPLEGRRDPVLQAAASDAKAIRSEDGSIAITLPAPATNATWGQPLGYPTHNPGHLEFSAQAMKKQWSASIGQGTSRDEPLMASPLIITNRVFAIDTRGRISAFDLASGKKLWSTETRGEKQAKDELSAGGGLAYGRGMIVATNGSRDIVAVNAQTGDSIWRTPLAAPLRGAPAVLAGRAYVTDAGNHVIALDTQNGEKLWNYDGMPEETALLGTPAPAVDDGRVVAPLSNGEIVALSLEDGQPLWNNRFNTTLAEDGLTSLRDIASVPVIDGGRAYAVNAAGRLMAVEVKAGSRLWQKDARGAGSLWAAGDTIFLVTREGVAARNAKDGVALWEAPLPQFTDADDKEGSIKWYGPYLLSGTLYAFGSDGKAVLFDPMTGKQIAVIDTEDKLAASPAVANGVLVTVSESGRLSAWK